MRRLLCVPVRYGYVPLMVFGYDAAAYAIVAHGLPYALLLPLLGLAWATAFLAERILPWNTEWNQPRGDAAANALHAVFYVLLTAGAALVVSALLRAFGSLGPQLWPAHWPLAVQLLLALAAVDCSFTLIHYLSHRSAILWRFHAVHHAAPRLYAFNGLVRHPLHLLLDVVVGTGPLVLIGMPLPVSMLLAFAITVALLVQHSNVKSSLGPLRNWLSIGALHHMHHVNRAAEGDCNFGFLTTIWDRVLGTFRAQPARPIGAADLGIEGMSDFALTYGAQLLFPFRPQSPSVVAGLSKVEDGAAPGR